MPTYDTEHEPEFDPGDWDDQMPEREPDWHDEFDRAEAAYEALPWWRRLLVDHEAWRADRRSRRAYRKAAKAGVLRPDGFDNEPPF